MTDFLSYLQRTREADDLPKVEVQKIEPYCKEGLGVADILERAGAEIALPATHVRRVCDAHQRFVAYRREAEARRGRLPDHALREATAPHQLDALERAQAMLGSDAKTLRATLELWVRCLSLARRDGEARIHGDPSHPGAAQFEEELGRREKLQGLTSHRWMRWRRGERDGILSVHIDFPMAALQSQARTVLGAYLEGRDPGEALQVIVMAGLEGSLRRMLDDWAEADAIRAAQGAFQGVLRTPNLDADLVGAVHVGDGYGGAVLDRCGEVLEAFVADDLNSVATVLERHGVGALVLPTRAGDPQKLAQVQRRLGKGRELRQVSPAGLAEARRDLEGPPRAMSAVVLGRRALNPMKEWTRLDPVRLGLAEYQHDLDEAKLRAAYQETLRIVRAEASRPSLPRPQDAAPAPGQSLVRSIDDLRPGLRIQGVITSVTQFGAFVNLGLADEGLIHVSELADHFVDDPSTVVAVGQRVSARVLAVDRSRRRISLSLRSEERPPRGRGATERSGKAKALADLQDLFRKR